MREKQIEAKLVRGIHAMGGRAYKFVSPGNGGVPDRLIVLPGGRIVFAELKAEGGRLSRIQQARIEELRRLGAEVFEVWGENGVHSLLDWCREYVREEAAAREV